MSRSRADSTLLLVLAAFCAGIVAPVSAQLPGTVEVGLFAQRTAFDELTTLAFGTSPGVGGSLGVYVHPNLALEASTSYTWTETAAAPVVGASWRPLRARLVLGIPVTETFYPMVGVGIVRNRYSDGVEGSDTGLGALVGFKTYLRERVAFRSELNIDRMGTPFNASAAPAGSASRHLNWHLSAGLSLDLGRGRFRDTDQDLVRDRLDLCPGTPLGVAVDGEGCRLDADLDRVFDEDDRCPGTPAGVAVDAVGCRVDTDQDGVFDEDDRCRATPAGVRVDAVGCALDTDTDGVADHLDLCLGTPAGATVDANGCRMDGDRDGVYDDDDRCPDTQAGAEVDDVGCPVLFVEEQVVLVLEGVTFETASADLTAEAQSVLDLIAESLLGNPEIRVRVNGHTDSTGSRAYNVTLSQNRADSVVRYLAERGVAADRMEARGFGPDQPAATNDTAEGRQENRRVELERIG